MIPTTFKIGPYEISPPTVMAPLAGITNLPFRLLAKRSGCGLVCSEMVSSNGLVRNSHKTYDLIATHPEEAPLSLQIFGADPEIMGRAAKIVQDHGAHILDINMGCAVKKIVKSGSGVALMQDPQKVGQLLDAVRKSVTIPVTVKIRSGYDVSGHQAVEIARIAQDCGVDAIAVHPRTASAAFRGKADWDIIARVKQSVSIPVIGNGDIVTPEDGLAMFAHTQCDAIMIGRAAIGKPWIFSQINQFVRGEAAAPVSLEMQFDALIQYVEASVKFLGEKQACFMMRSRLGWFTKGLRSSSQFRESIKQISSLDQAREQIVNYRRFLEGANSI